MEKGLYFHSHQFEAVEWFVFFIAYHSNNKFQLTLGKRHFFQRPVMINIQFFWQSSSNTCQGQLN
jgi:hypothetical protein